MWPPKPLLEKEGLISRVIKKAKPQQPHSVCVVLCVWLITDTCKNGEPEHGRLRGICTPVLMLHCKESNLGGLRGGIRHRHRAVVDVAGTVGC